MIKHLVLNLVAAVDPSAKRGTTCGFNSENQQPAQKLCTESNKQLSQPLRRLPSTTTDYDGPRRTLNYPGLILALLATCPKKPLNFRNPKPPFWERLELKPLQCTHHTQISYASCSFGMASGQRSTLNMALCLM